MPRKEKPSDKNPALKEKKEAILKGTRKKMGISEEKRADFQSRMKEKRERQKGKPVDNSEAKQIRSELAADQKARGVEPKMRTGDFRSSPIRGLDQRDYDAYQKMKQTDQRVKEVAATQNITPEAARETVLARQQERAAQVREVRAGLVDKRMEERKNRIMANRGITAEEAGNVMAGRIAQRAGQIASNRGITMEQATNRAQNQMFGQRGLKGAVERARMGDRREAAAAQMATQQNITLEAAAQAMATQVAQRAENISNRRGIAIGEAEKRAQRQMFGRPGQRQR